MSKEDNENSNYILENFNKFFSQLSQEFPPKDAYKIYSEKALIATDGDEAIELMKKSLQESKKLIKNNTIEENMGKLWTVENARPFIKCKKDLGKLYEKNNYIDLAIKEYEDILKLDKDDNINIKYELVPIFFSKKRYKDIYDLTEKYSVENSLFMLYLKSLYYFCENDNINSKRFIKRSLDTNIYVTQYMLFIKEDEDLNTVSRDEFIGMVFAKEMIRSWGQSELAMTWLMNEYFTYCHKYDIDVILTKDKVKNKIREFFHK